MPLNLSHARERLQQFRFQQLFIEELGWSQPTGIRAVHPATTTKQGNVAPYTATPIAHLAGVVVFEVVASGDGAIPEARARALIAQEVARLHHENLLIFLNAERSQSLWYWVKREHGKAYPRDHLYVQGQPGDLFLSKLAAMVVDISELDAGGNIAVTEVAGRLKAALDVERVTKRFYKEFQHQHLDFLALIGGIPDERQRRWYASVLMNRLMFIYFLQRKYFLDNGNTRYLQEKLAQSRKTGPDRYYPVFLQALFFEGFAKPERGRDPAVKLLLGQIKYLNGGLFLPHRVETANPAIRVPDLAFENLFALFERYSWNLDDTPGGNDDEINPDVLGYIFEKYINQKEFGAYYTRPEITGYLCEQTIYKLVLDKVNAAVPPPPRQFASMPELLLGLDAPLCRRLLHEVLPGLSLLDPACGSGAFLVAAMKTLINLYSAIVGKIDFLHDRALADWLAAARAAHPSLHYFIKKRIITDNLYGVDIMEEGAEIARLRLFLALVASAHTIEQLEPLPNIDFNILAGNSLIGLLKVDPQRFDAVGERKPATAVAGKQGLITLPHDGSDVELPAFAVETTVAPSQREKVAAFVAGRNAGKFAAILADKNQSIALYRKHAFRPEENDVLDQDTSLIQLRGHIDNVRTESYARLNQLLLDEFKALGIQFEQATWDDAKNKEGKPIKRALTLADIEALNPFHWGYEFDQIINGRGGFDAIITNPPWENFKPDSKEFFQRYADGVTKNKMSLEEFEQRKAEILTSESSVRSQWLGYLSHFSHVNLWFRNASAYKNQTAIVNGKKATADLNLYKLFLEQTLHLIRKGGYCGIVIPSGIYTDLGATRLRQMLFEETRITGLFGFENRRQIFENVDSRFKFVVLTFELGEPSKKFPAAFMRHDVAELAFFPNADSLFQTLPLIRKLAPATFALLEFKDKRDAGIVERAFRFPGLGEKVPGAWQVDIGREFHATDDSNLFFETPNANRLPLYGGRTIHQFTNSWSEPRFWLEEKAARASLLGRESDTGQILTDQDIG